ncbi:type II toxin-antitoxin system VapC family toxin [Candidatus Microgenomates bacterium]|nr:type II toxin-antitoxin system VapC family toxin [Candidatus Microgenomates bacterium]
MSKFPVVIVDSDALIAQVNPKDIHHQKATQISKKLVDIKARVIYPATTIAEATVHMQRVLNSTAAAYGTVKLMTDPAVQVAEVNQQTLVKALEYFSPKTSKKNTLFDCIVASVAEENEADAIFSFDKFYKKNGFKLASEFLKLSS